MSMVFEHLISYNLVNILTANINTQQLKDLVDSHRTKIVDEIVLYVLPNPLGSPKAL